MAERFEIVQKALLKMLEDKKYASLRDILVTMNPSDIAGLFEDLEEKQIPKDLDFHAIGGLRLEARQKLSDLRPDTVGKASRIPGVSPADISVLLVALAQRGQHDEAE